MTTLRRKLIEVALPLEAINKASAREKLIKVGKPTSLHLWWSRKPLATARAVILAQMVDDPSSHPDIFPTGEAQDQERERLFRIIEDLVQWENTANREVLDRARAEIWKSWRGACADNSDHPRADQLFDRHRLPAFHDPFAGGGSLPLEAQRLGLETYASELNPVAVLINKALIEIPPKFAGRTPVGPVPEAQKQRRLNAEWRGPTGLAEDVRRYGEWIREEAEKRLGYLYPKAEITGETAREQPHLKPLVGQKLTVIAWLWARTVRSPNPAFAHTEVPLVSSFMLSAKLGKEVYIQPVVEGDTYRFTVKVGKPKDTEAAKNGTMLARGSFRCLISDVPIGYRYVDDEANAGRIGARLMAIVAEGERGRVYLSPSAEFEDVSMKAQPTWKPDVPCRGTWASNAQGRRYGFRTFGDYFTPRQLVALTTLSELVQEARELVRRDAGEAAMPDDGRSLAAGGTGATAYADAIAVYLALVLSRVADWNNSLSRWERKAQVPQQLFAGQGIPMTWDYCEANPLSSSTGSFIASVKNVERSLINGAIECAQAARASQIDARTQDLSFGKVVSSDPPYYDNVGYADLSDFFYIWLHRSLKKVFPDLFATLMVPKGEELVATQYRHGGKDHADAFFLDGMTRAMRRLAEQAHPAYPVTIYYAFKQTETKAEGTVSTGWETFLEAMIRSGFVICGTWPMRTELDSRMIGMGTNSLASSTVLVCRPRASDAPTATRREFLTMLRSELPAALAHLQRGNIAPVDLAQAAIGPGMAVYTRYARVLDVEGKPLSVREALALINETLDEALAEQEGDFDADSRWALAWFEQSGFTEGEYGVAETLSKAKNTSVGGMVEADIVVSRGGRVRLLRPDELPAAWDPATSQRLTVWEVVHHLIRVLEAGGERPAAELTGKLGSKAQAARELAYRLYTICERKKRAAEALSYNGLVQSWPEIRRLAREGGKQLRQQEQLFEQKPSKE
jgi:putative DNA methylase